MLWWYWAIVINACEAYMHSGFKAALYSHFLVMYLFWWIILFLLVILATAIVTVYERKLMADIQSRRGPSKPGYLGLLQPIADALKLIVKEHITPRGCFDTIYIIIALLSFVIAAFFWNVPTLSYENPSFFTEWTIMIAFLISIIHVYTILFAGWSSNSRYSFLGALRTSAQLIAYDIVIVLVYLNIFFATKEMSFESFVEFQEEVGSISVFIPIQLLIFFIALLAETSRHPFDMPEAEAELVAGYNVEYSSIRFAMFFLAEYSTVIFSAAVMNILFFGGFSFDSGLFEFLFWLLKMLFLIYIIIKARALLPRYRYDQLMEIGWKILIPFEIVALSYNLFLVGLI